jgi:hypothetical protein
LKNSRAILLSIILFIIPSCGSSEILEPESTEEEKENDIGIEYHDWEEDNDTTTINLTPSSKLKIRY